MPELPDVAVVVLSEPALAAVRAVTAPGVPVEVLARSEAADATAPADLVLVAADVTLPPGWLDALLAARGDDGTVATVDALALVVADVAAARARLQDTPVLRPRTFAPTWACTLVTRAALDLAGPLDDGFAARCSAYGLLHVAAGDVPVAVTEPADAADEEPEPLRRARARALALAEPLSVTIDARIVRAPVAGTQVHTLELLAALARTGALRLRALVPPDPTPTAAAVLAGLDGVELLDSDDLDDGTPASAIVHRPYQVSSAIDLLTLRQVGERLVVTHQDLLTYHNPAYHPDRETWLGLRRLTGAALDAAHVVVAFSEHAAADLRAEDLAERVRVVPIGVDHRLAELAADPRPPAKAEALADRPFLLCLGTDLRHKNRPFAAALAQALRARHGWPGRLVLAGPHASIGAGEPASDQDLLDLGVVDEAEKAWLYAHAAAVVYPTTYEGFGLIPFEAAAHGTPCLFAPQAALRETLPDEATLVPWDAEASADRVIGLLAPGPDRDAHLAAIRAAGARLTWDETARALIAVYGEALSTRPAGGGWAVLETEAGLREWEHRYWSLFNGIGPTGLSLVGEDGSLPETAQRTLAALARRPLTRRALLTSLRAIDRIGNR